MRGEVQQIRRITIMRRSLPKKGRQPVVLWSSSKRATDDCWMSEAFVWAESSLLFINWAPGDDRCEIKIPRAIQWQYLDRSSSCDMASQSAGTDADSDVHTPRIWLDQECPCTSATRVVRWADWGRTSADELVILGHSREGLITEHAVGTSKTLSILAID